MCIYYRVQNLQLYYSAMGVAPDRCVLILDLRPVFGTNKDSRIKNQHATPDFGPGEATCVQGGRSAGNRGSVMMRNPSNNSIAGIEALFN